AVGQGTATTLGDYSINLITMPTFPDSEHVLTLDALQSIKNQTILLFKGEGGRTLIENTLKTRGAKVIILPVYKRIMSDVPEQIINSLWREDAVDIILLTSEQSMHHLFQMIGADAHNWLREKPCLVISERLALIASLLGMKKIITSHPDKMMSTLFDYKGLIYGESQ
ncbi:MAG: uroporphyrinogen-III synthase, partial [bacterium]|nr:uroporphyrinogen-III synthase [bacterium]